ncbi:MAG: MFS transporter [Candidatus Ancaeobacter aquaticus]|nr:MFS transporter [Candidatus Ancaeobacter aquaticus]
MNISSENITGITEQQLTTGLNAVVKDGIMSHLMGIFTSGVFLVGIALHLGASNFEIGLIAAIPPLSQLIQIPAIYLIEAVNNRKKIVLASAFISRFAWLFVALSPFLFSPSMGIIILIGAILFQSTIGGIAGCAWNSWMRDLIPEDRMGRFFSSRLRIATLIGIFASLIASFVVDGWKQYVPTFTIGGYIVLFLAGFIVGMIGLFYVNKIPNIPIVPQKIKFFSLIKKPFKDKNFKRLLVFLATWSFAINLAAPFFTVYMLKRLGLDMSGVVMMSIISQAFNFAFLGLWGKWTDHFSNKSVLAASGPIFILCILAWTFTTLPDKYFLTIPLLIGIHILMGISTAGITIAVGNIGLKLAPKGEGTAYLGASTLIISLAAGIAPIIGGKLADFFSTQNLSLILEWTGVQKSIIFRPINFSHWDFLFGLAAIIGLFALHKLSLVEEKGQVDEKIVLNELMASVKRPLRSLSTGAGLLQLISYPLIVLKSKNKKEVLKAS